MNRQKVVKTLAFSLMGVLVLVLVCATIAEQLYGSDFAVQYFYTSPWTIVLWGLAVVFGVWHLLDMVHTFSVRNVVLWALHFSFVVILAGALTTHLFGTHSDLHLRVGETTEQYGFPLALRSFRIINYVGTDTPSDYQAALSIGTVSMNKPVGYDGYRFFLSSYDSDQQGCVFIVRHDPVGTAITHIGYLLLLLSLLAYMLLPHLSKILHKSKTVAGKCAVVIGMLVLFPIATDAKPQTIPKQQAQELGSLCVFYNGRIEPLGCLATDFTEKLYGKTSYGSYTAEQVYAGWLFSPYTWLDEPIIKLKSADSKLLGLDSRYVSYNQLYVVKSSGVELPARVGEKYALIGMLLSGELTRIFPYVQTDSVIEWVSYSSKLPIGTNFSDWTIIKRSIDYMGELMFEQDYETLSYTIGKISRYQQKQAGVDNLPSPMRLRAELLWSKFAYTKPLAMIAIVFGLLSFLIYCLSEVRGKVMPRWWQTVIFIVLVSLWMFLTVMLGWRWYISGHIPMSNGHETMQVLSWLIMLTGIVGKLRRSTLFRDYGAVLLLAAMPLLVSMMSASNPQITHLVPVLQSPLLSLHVSIIMLSFAFLAFVMLNGLVALFVGLERQIALRELSLRLLRPAVCCLTIGIFIGAVWANVSWGRYWGWDPKEVWALITLLVYAAPLHEKSLSAFRKPLFFHVYCVVAFLSVLFTYFGVNYLLGGLHAYA